jgi:hypothetical protein
LDTIASTLAESVTSTSTGIARPPAASTNSTVERAAARSTSATATVAPLAASLSAVA